MSATVTVETRIPDEQLREMVRLLAEALAPLIMEPKGLTVADVCDMLQLESQTLTKWERDGILVPFRYGRIIRYSRAQIAALLASGDLNALAEHEAAA